MHRTYQELKSQYEALRLTFDYIVARREEIDRFYRRHMPRSLIYVGCGSSYYLAKSAELTAWSRLDIPATSLPAGDLMLHGDVYRSLLRGAMLIVPTRSGSTSEVLLALAKAKAIASTPILAVTCVTNGEVARIADFTLELPWAFDTSVCQTRTVSNLYAANLLILAALNGEASFLADLDRAIREGPRFMAAHEEELAAVAREEWRNVTILADGELRGIAREGALAFTEIARVPGAFYHLLDVRHGPMVLVDDRTLVLAVLSGDGAEYEHALVADLLKRGAKVIIYSDLPQPPLKGVRLQVDSGRRIDPAVRGLPFAFLVQALAYYKAVYKGVDPDRPEGLDPYIKL